MKRRDWFKLIGGGYCAALIPARPVLKATVADRYAAYTAGVQLGWLERRPFVLTDDFVLNFSKFAEELKKAERKLAEGNRCLNNMMIK